MPTYIDNQWHKDVLFNLMYLSLAWYIETAALLKIDNMIMMNIDSYNKYTHELEIDFSIKNVFCKV